MLRIGPQLATWASPMWISVAAAALLAVILCALVLGRSGKSLAATAGRLLLIALAGAMSASLTWSIWSGLERDALQARAAELTARALAPGSPLACLDALTGETVQGACETAVFASPASVATATAYVAAQFGLLSDITDYVRRGGPNVDDMLVPLRRSLEADPFGILAHVLVMKGCTSENCPALAVLHDPRHVRTNMIAQTLDHYVDQYRAVWARSTDAASGVAEASVPEPGKRRLPVDIDFPTAASIPPISIMNPEPKGSANPEAARKDKPSARNSVDPVWTPAPAAGAK